MRLKVVGIKFGPVTVAHSVTELSHYNKCPHAVSVPSTAVDNAYTMQRTLSVEVLNLRRSVGEMGVVWNNVGLTAPHRYTVTYLLTN